jgi:DNA-binding NarL/FixJ family response regulator
MLAPNAEFHVLEPYRAKLGKVRAVAARAAVSVEARDALRISAIAADASATTDINLSLLWRELARGTSTVVDDFFFEDRCYLVLALKTDVDASPLEGRRLEILEAVLGGLRQKNIAIDLQLAPSTVALNSRLALESLGLSCKPSRAHPLLMLAARAVTEPTVALAKCSAFVGDDDRELRVIAVSRPDRTLQEVLPAAELAVIRSLVEGLSYQEIARRRGTSTRTIANQISAVFRRLRVSGRNELVQRLFFDDVSEQASPKVLSETLVPPTVADPKGPAGSEGARRSA